MAATHQYFSPILENRSMPPGSIIPELGYHDLRLADVDAHHQHVEQRGARILQPPENFAFGERQYSVEDIGGYRWTFSQSIADADPAEWGGRAAERVSGKAGGEIHWGPPVCLTESRKLIRK